MEIVARSHGEGLRIGREEREDIGEGARNVEEFFDLYSINIVQQ